MTPAPTTYPGYRFSADLISHAVWLHHTFALSLRDVELILAERGISVTHESIRRWCGRFGAEFAARLRRRRPRPGDVWHLDEVFLRIVSVVHGPFGGLPGVGDRGGDALPCPGDPRLPFKANADRRHHIPKQQFRAKNWITYEAALHGRGSLTIWFTDAALAAWKAEPRTTRGGKPRYSPLAIVTALTLRAVFRLALRQTEGLIGSIIALLGLNLAVPDHSTLSRDRAHAARPSPAAHRGAWPHGLAEGIWLQLAGPGGG